MNEMAKLRLAAEEGWLNLGHDLGLSTQVFRLGGIYGPGRRLFFVFELDHICCFFLDYLCT